MKTPNLLIALLAAMLMASCGLPEDHVRITGEYTNISDAEFYIYDETGETGIFDTLQIRDGRFTYERPIESPCVLTLLFPNFTELRLVAEPGKEITVKGEASQLMKTDIGGTETNEALTRFRLENGSHPASDQLLAAAEFIRSHASSLAAQAIFMQYFAKAEQFNTRTLELIKAMRRAQPANSVLTAYERRMSHVAAMSPGATLPPFTAVDIDGDTVRSSDYGRRPLIVLFWASWSSDSRGYAAALRRCRRAYGKNFDALTISFDYSVPAARRRAESDSIPKPIVCDGEAFGSPLARTLGMRYVPGLLLIDKNRKIVARDLPSEELYNALGDLLAR